MNYLVFICKTIFIVTLAILLGLGNCGSKEQSPEEIADKVIDQPWTGDPNTIPEPMRATNPVASPEAIKGGIFRIFAEQFPRSLNYYLDQMSISAEIFTAMYEPLTSNHPLTLERMPHIAKSWKISDDKKEFTFSIDPNAKWSDGKPITAHDVEFTYQLIMNPAYNTAVFRIGLSRFEPPKVLDDYTIQFTAKSIHWNNFDELASGFFILPKHFYEGKDFNKFNFEFPVTSGPYTLKEAKKGRYIKMVRRGDYWQRAYPFIKGRFNFDVLLYKNFNDRNLAFQAFKKGDMDFYAVYTAQIWAEETKGDKFEKNWIIKQRIFNKKPVGFQGWVMNLRRDIFKDKKVRKAMTHLLDRKKLIEKLMFNEYAETNSYYPDFYLLGQKSSNPPSDFSIEESRKLLAEAGWKPNSKGILEKDGKEFEFTVLDRDKTTEKFFTLFIEKAKEVGIKVKIETTDLAAWSARVDKFDFDMTWAAWGGGIFKDPEPLWFSKYADENGQHNLSGLKIKEVDELIEKQKTEFDINIRNEIVKKIDQIIFLEYPYVLLWHLDNSRILYWNKFGKPKDPLGKFGSENFATDYWWIDPKKAEALNKAVKENSSLPKEDDKLYWKD